MTQGDLDRMKEAYSFLAGIQARILEEGETILSTRPSEITFYEVVPYWPKVPNSSHH